MSEPITITIHATAEGYREHEVVIILNPDVPDQPPVVVEDVTDPHEHMEM